MIPCVSGSPYASMGDIPFDADAIAVVEEALGGRARALARDGDTWREVPLDAGKVPERLEIVAREADPLVVVVTLDRTRCSGVRDDERPSWHDLDATVELRVGVEVLERWQGGGVVTKFVGADEMMRTSAAVHVGTRAQHGVAASRDFGMMGFFPQDAERPPAPPLPLSLARDRSALLASLDDGALVAWQEALVARMIAAPAGSSERMRLRPLLVEAEAAAVGFNRDAGGLAPGARVAIRAAVERGALTPAEQAELGTAALVGDPALAGATMPGARAAPGGPWGIRWWVAGIEVPPGAAAPVGGLVDVRWDVPSGWDRGRMIATLGPGVRVVPNTVQGDMLVEREPAITCAWYAYEPGVRWHEGGLAWGRDIAPKRLIVEPAPTLRVSARDRDGDELVQRVVGEGLAGLYRFRYLADPPRIEVAFEPGAEKCEGAIPVR